jgi:predicted DNA-binding transcriptional regulator YafY
MSTRQREYNHTCFCDECGAVFHAARYDAHYCTPTCRKRANRKQAAMAAAKQRALDAIADYVNQFSSPEGYQAALDQIKDWCWLNSLVKYTRDENGDLPDHNL